MNYYTRYFKKIRKVGTRINSRGMPASALYNVAFATSTGKTYRRPRDNPMIGFVEGLQFVSGTYNIDDIARVAPHARLDLFGPASAYGLRLNQQLYHVVETLLFDPETRQAVIAVADPTDTPDTRPCTTSLQFQKLGASLMTIVTMRSSDTVWGLPYDLIQFSMMAFAVSACTGLTPGPMIVNIGNAHVYDSTAELGVGFKPWTFIPPFTSRSVNDWQEWAFKESKIVTIDRLVSLYEFRPTETD